MAVVDNTHSGSDLAVARFWSLIERGLTLALCGPERIEFRSMESPTGVPTLKFTDFGSGDAAVRSDFARALRDAFRDFGFVVLDQPPLPNAGPGSVGEVYRAFRQFFALDIREKNKSGGIAGGQRGYTGFGIEHALDHAAPDLKEFFHVGQTLPDGHALTATYPVNVWPEETRELAAVATELFRQLEGLSSRLLHAIGRCYGLPGERFSELIEAGNSVLRAVNYPVVDSPPDDALRAAAHEDINLITLLCEATDAGLEIRPPGSDEWLRVETPPGQIVADSGDMLSRLTNDLIPATTHRVVTPAEVAGRCRYSLPFFAHPRPDCDLSVLPRFVSADRPCRHASITAGGYLAERLREIGLVS